MCRGQLLLCKLHLVLDKGSSRTIQNYLLATNMLTEDAGPDQARLEVLELPPINNK